MKKLLGLATLGLCLFGLTSCDMGSGNYDYNIHNETKYESHVYCTYNTTCTGCEKWASDIDISSAYSINCTEVYSNMSYGSLTHHEHYCVTYIK